MGRPQLLTQFGGRECASRSETFSACQRRPSLSLRRDRCAQISRHRHSKWRSTSGDASGVDRCRKPACFVSQETLAYLRSVRLLSMHGYGRRAPRIAEICKLSCIRSKKLNRPSGHFFCTAFISLDSESKHGSQCLPCGRRGYPPRIETPLQLSSHLQDRR